jgi:hypothetical protein
MICYSLFGCRLYHNALASIPGSVRIKERVIIYIIVSISGSSSFTIETGSFAPYFHQRPMGAGLAR